MASLPWAGTGRALNAAVQPALPRSVRSRGHYLAVVSHASCKTTSDGTDHLGWLGQRAPRYRRAARLRLGQGSLEDRRGGRGGGDLFQAQTGDGPDFFMFGGGSFPAAHRTILAVYAGSLPRRSISSYTAGSVRTCKSPSRPAATAMRSPTMKDRPPIMRTSRTFGCQAGRSRSLCARACRRLVRPLSLTALRDVVLVSFRSRLH